MHTRSRQLIRNPYLHRLLVVVTCARKLITIPDSDADSYITYPEQTIDSENKNAAFSRGRQHLYNLDSYWVMNSPTPRSSVLEGIEKLNLTANSELEDYSDESNFSDDSTNKTWAQTSTGPKVDLKNSNNKRPRNPANNSSASIDIPPKRPRPSFDMLPGLATVVATECFVVDIIPAEDGVLLTDAQGKTVGNSLSRALFAAENFAELKFESSGLERGRYRIICADTVTQDWVIGIITNLEGLWTGANLNVKSGPPAKLIRATVNVTLPSVEPNDMFTIIGTQNPTVNTENWKLYSRSKAQAGKQQWVIGVDETSIPALKDLNCRPYCGMGRIRIFLPNNAM